MDLVLRKRVGLNIYKRQSIAERLKKSKWLGRGEIVITQSGVTYEVVSNIPKASEELEDRESLAQLAASGDDCSAIDGETYIGNDTTQHQAVHCVDDFSKMKINFCRKIYAWRVSRRKYFNFRSIETKCCY